jgi:hypothetical protein
MNKLLRVIHVVKAAWWARGVYGWQDWIDATDRRAMLIDYNRCRWDYASAGAMWQERATRRGTGG